MGECKVIMTGVDPKQALVDFHNVDVDLSADIDEAQLKQSDYGV